MDTHRTGEPGEPSPLSFGLKFLLGLAVWLCLVTLQASRIYYGWGGPDIPPISWQQTLVWALGDWGLWGLVSLLVYRVASKVSLDRTTWHRALVVHIPLAVVIVGIRLVLYSNFAWLTGGCTIYEQAGVTLHEASTNMVRVRAASDAITYVLIVFICYGLIYYRRYRAKQSQHAEIQTQLAKAQLQNLRGHLQPHFLFNTLHTIAAFVDLEPSKASLMIARLSDLLRASLDTVDEQTTSLREEMEFLNRYLDIQKVRFEDRLKVTIDIPPTLMDAKVPTMILQPLVENAVQHGVAPRSMGGNIAVRGSAVGGELQLQVIDDGPGPPAEQRELLAAGKGLAITADRLRTLYGEHQDLRIEAVSPDGTTVTVIIPLEKGPAEPEPNDHG
jgi:two-component system LytT family sensor kinase